MNNRLFVEMRKKGEFNLSVLNSLPGNSISLAATIQYLDFLPRVKKYLEHKGKKVIIKKGSFYPGQVLGCNSIAFDKNADTLLLLADGSFHARGNALDLNKEVYIYNGQSIEVFSKEEIEKLKLKKKVRIAKFLHADSVGLILSTKPGQNFQNWKAIKKKLEKKHKKVYVFETDNINLAELENFPLTIYINTACPGLSLDSNKIVNLKDILEFL